MRKKLISIYYPFLFQKTPKESSKWAPRETFYKYHQLVNNVSVHLGFPW